MKAAPPCGLFAVFEDLRQIPSPFMSVCARQSRAVTLAALAPNPFTFHACPSVAGRAFLSDNSSAVASSKFLKLLYNVNENRDIIATLMAQPL
jgi:hypothetical protein